MSKSILQPNEEWRDIDGYENLYQVSNFGRVRSLDRIYYQKSKYGSMMQKKYKGKILKPQKQQTKYYVVYLLKNTKRKRVYVHRIVAEAFIENPDNKKEVNHKDLNTMNNNATNLEWVTRQENITHLWDNYRNNNFASKYNTRKIFRNRQTSTGEKYITRKNNKYRFSIYHEIDSYFDTLEEAIKAREMYFYDKEYPST